MTISVAGARDIKSAVSRSPPASVSTSPSTTFHSLRSGSSSPFATRNSYFPQIPEKQLKPFATEDIKILLLENINESARTILEGQGYQVEFFKSALLEEELIEKIKFVPYISRYTRIIPNCAIEPREIYYDLTLSLRFIKIPLI